MENILIFLAVTVVGAIAVAIFNLRKSNKPQSRTTKDPEYHPTTDHHKVG